MYAPHPSPAASPKATLASRVSSALRTSILTGELPPGLKINLDQVRKHYSISVSSVREAMGRLVADGLVEFEDQRGYRVAPISLANLEEITRLRMELEPLALRATIAAGDIEWESAVMGALYRLNRTERTASDLASIEAWEAAHRTFHQALISGCRMPLLLNFCAILHNQNDRYRRRFLLIRSGDRNVVEEHAAIAEAAVAHDADRAGALLKRHIERTGTNLLRHLQSALAPTADGGAS